MTGGQFLTLDILKAGVKTTPAFIVSGHRRAQKDKSVAVIKFIDF
jgi:hypothetical protein